MTSSDRAQSSRADNISSDAAESEDEEEHSRLVSLVNLLPYHSGLIIKLATLTPHNEDDNGIKIGSVRSNSYLEY